MLSFIAVGSALFFLHAIVRFFPIKIWFLEMTVHFGEYALVAAIVLLGLTLFFGSKFSVRNYVLCIAVNCVTLYLQAFPMGHFYVEPTEPASLESKSYSVFYANVNALGNVKGDLNGLLTQHSPDVISLVEFTEEWLANLPYVANYEHRAIQYEPGAYGMAVFSKHEFIERNKDGLGFDLVPTLHLRFSDLGLNFSLVHMMPPLDKFSYWHNRTLARRLATQYRHSNEPSLVVGDFNATPYSIVYGVLGYGAELNNAFAGYSIPRTWSQHHWLYKLPIDHIFYKGPINIQDSKVLEDFGSDHLPLLVKFSL